MALGFEDEFDYLEENKDLTLESEEAPKIKSVAEHNVEEVEEEKEKPKEEVEEPKEEIPEDSIIFVVKVTTNKEERAVELISGRVKVKELQVYAIARPHGLRGYVFLEALDRENAEEAVFNLPYVKGIIPRRVSYSELKPMVEPATADVKIEKNDIVEIIAEPFKKEKAKVVRIDKAKGEAVVSLLSAVVPIPVTVKLDNIRVIRREEVEEEENS